MKFYQISTFALSAVVLVGCASGFQYYPGSESYRDGPQALKDIIVNVDLHTAKSPEGYLKAPEIEALIKQDIIQNLSADGRLKYTPDSNNGLVAKVYVNYTRRFSYGDALAKPLFSGKTTILDKDKEIGSYSYGEVTTSFGTFGDAAVNLQVGTGTWDAEDEPRDFEMVAKSVASDLDKF